MDRSCSISIQLAIHISYRDDSRVTKLSFYESSKPKLHNSNENSLNWEDRSCCLSVYQQLFSCLAQAAGSLCLAENLKPATLCNFRKPSTYCAIDNQLTQFHWKRRGLRSDFKMPVSWKYHTLSTQLDTKMSTAWYLRWCFHMWFYQILTSLEMFAFVGTTELTLLLLSSLPRSCCCRWPRTSRGSTSWSVWFRWIFFEGIDLNQTIY